MDWNGVTKVGGPRTKDATFYEGFFPLVAQDAIREGQSV